MLTKQKTDPWDYWGENSKGCSGSAASQGFTADILLASG